MASRPVPLVTAGVPVYNGGDRLRRALESLLAQDHPALQVLVSDNASVDGTWEVAQEVAARDPRVVAWRNPVNVGSIANFARVLEAARGEYFMWAAHDDEWDPSFVSTLVAELERHPEAAVAMSAIDHATAHGSRGPVVRYVGDDDPHRLSWLRLALRQAGGGPHFQYIYGLYRTEFLRRAYLRTPEVACSDGLFTVQVAMATPFRYVDRVLTTRFLSELSWDEKYPEDPMGRRIADPAAYLHTLRAAVPYLARSEAVPWPRKLALPLVLGRLSWWLARLTAGSLRQRRRAARRAPSPEGTRGG